MSRKKNLTISSIVISAVIILTLAVYLPLTIAANSSEKATEVEGTSINEAVDDDGPGDIEDADEANDDSPGAVNDDDEPGDIDGPGDVEDVD